MRKTTWMDALERFRELAVIVLSHSEKLVRIDIDLDYIEFDGSAQYETSAITHFFGDHQDEELDVIPSVRRLEREAEDLLRAVLVDSEEKYDISFSADRNETSLLVEPHNELSAHVQFAIVAPAAASVRKENLRGIARIERRGPQQEISGHTKMVFAGIETLAALRDLDDMETFLASLAEEEEMDRLAPLLASALEGEPDAPVSIDLDEAGRQKISIDMSADFLL